MEEEFLCPRPCATVDRIGFCHSISLIYTAHVAVIIRHNLQLYGLPIIIAEITLCWCVVNICQNTYGCQVTPSPYLKVAPSQSLGGPSPLACPSCWVGQCHNSKHVSWPSRRISPGTRSNCPCTLCGHLLVFSLSILTLSHELQSDVAQCTVCLCPNKLSYHTCIQSHHTVCKF